MKKFSDYKGEDAIDLWTDLLTPMTAIFGDPVIASTVRSKKPAFIIAQEIIKRHKKEALDIVLRVDDTPVDGLNIVTRIVTLVLEFANSEELRGFFESSQQGQTGNASGGSATENTGDAKAEA